MAKKIETVSGWLMMADQKVEAAEVLYRAGYFDDAISRPYYGMFYAAKAALLSIEVEVKSYSGLVNQFGRHFVKTGKVDRSYNRMLATALKMHEVSDYSFQVVSIEPQAAEIIADLKQFIQKVREILAER